MVMGALHERVNPRGRSKARPKRIRKPTSESQPMNRTIERLELDDGEGGKITRRPSFVVTLSGDQGLITRAEADTIEDARLALETLRADLVVARKRQAAIELRVNAAGYTTGHMSPYGPAENTERYNGENFAVNIAGGRWNDIAAAIAGPDCDEESYELAYAKAEKEPVAIIEKRGRVIDPVCVGPWCHSVVIVTSADDARHAGWLYGEPGQTWEFDGALFDDVEARTIEAECKRLGIALEPIDMHEEE